MKELFKLLWEMNKMLLMVVFVVLMILWLFGGVWYVYQGPSPNPVAFGTGTLIPWVCVAILGYAVFNGVSVNTPTRTERLQQLHDKEYNVAMPLIK